MTRKISGFGAFIAIVCLISSAHGAIVSVPNVSVQVGVSPVTVWPSGTDNGDGTYNYYGSTSNANWDFSWDVTVDPDPFVSAFFGIKNNTGITQTFVLNVNLPIAPPLPGATLKGGSIGITLTDSNFSGSATIASVLGGSIYDAQTDGSSALTLLTNASLSANAFAGQSVTTSAVGGLPGPSLPHGAVLTSIGINHTFTLTAGDTASFTSFFIVEPVPEPSTITLAAMGFLASLGLYFRRKR